jgi:hypothetical protein
MKKNVKDENVVYTLWYRSIYVEDAHSPVE